jgi:hypothetical protein
MWERHHPCASCAKCGHGMQLVRSIPGLGAFPELLVFRCPTCNEVDTKEAEPHR